MTTIDPAAMVQRFQERAAGVRKRNMPPIAGAERKAFVQQAELDYLDFALIGDSVISLDDGVLTIDLRPAICDAAIRGVGHLEQETKVAMENIASARPLDYLKHLPTDGAKITPKMLDSKADLQALIDGAEMFRVVETVQPIDVKSPGFSLAHGYLA
jgi:hypothetical protein